MPAKSRAKDLWSMAAPSTDRVYIDPCGIDVALECWGKARALYVLVLHRLANGKQMEADLQCKSASVECCTLRVCL